MHLNAAKIWCYGTHSVLYKGGAPRADFSIGKSVCRAQPVRYAGSVAGGRKKTPDSIQKEAFMCMQI